jgi:hypothetical protein
VQRCVTDGVPKQVWWQRPFPLGIVIRATALIGPPTQQPA